jgi:hypothetical protein
MFNILTIKEMQVKTLSWWLTPVIFATWKAEVRRIAV